MNQPNEELASLRYNAPRLQAQVTWSAKQIAAKDAEIARLKAESEGRRKELLKVGEERKSEWTRAEAAEELRATLEATRKRLDTLRQEVAAVCDSMEGPIIGRIGRAIGISYSTVEMWARLLRAALAEGKG